ncbi:hypothetical protein MKX01_014169 [Papaver californicum]|nr:hypothetical protein MKX01_014169 [Papaver californicum]
MVHVRISRKWNELDFMGMNEVTSLDLFMLDDNGDELHGVVPKKLIWKFDPLLRVGGVYSLNKFTILGEKKIFCPARNEHRLFFNGDTEVKYLCGTPAEIPHHKFTFTPFEDLESRSSNTYLTDVIGVLISLTNLQQKKRGNGQACVMRDFTLQNLSGINVKITLWGESTTELSRNLDTHRIKETPVVVVVVSSAYVRKYQECSLSLTNATKVFFNLGIPEVLEMKEGSCRITPARRNKQPVIDLTMTETTKTICELLECKWDPAQQALNRIAVKARATRVLTTNGCYYLWCNKCTAKVVGDYGCTRCEHKVEEPIPRYLLRFEVTDDTGSALFTALDSKVQRIVHASASDMVILGEEEGRCKVVAAFEELLDMELDY